MSRDFVHNFVRHFELCAPCAPFWRTRVLPKHCVIYYFSLSGRPVTLHPIVYLPLYLTLYLTMMYVPHVPHFEVHLGFLIFGVLQELGHGSLAV